MVRTGLIKWAKSVQRSPSVLLMLWLLLFVPSQPTQASEPSEFLRLAALGRNDCPLGSLYVQSTDQCLPYKLWDEAYLANYTVFERVNHEKYKFASGDSFNAASDLFDMDAIVKMSFMFGLLSVEGSASVFKEKSANSLTQRVSMLWQRSTATKSIRMEALFEHPERMYRKVLETKASHVVVRVHYGGSFGMVFESQAANEAEASRIAGSLDVVVRSIPGFSINGRASLNLTESQKQVANSMTVKCDGDVNLPAPILSYESAQQTCQKLPEYFEQTFHIGPDGMPIGGGNPGNPMVLEMVPLKDFFSEALNLMYKISDDIVNEAVEVVERMDNILKRCNTKMAIINQNLQKAFPRLIKEMQSFYSMIDEFKAQTERSIQALIPKLRSGFVGELQLSELVSEANRRLDLADPDGWLELMDQQAAQFGGVLAMLPRPVDDANHSGCQLTKEGQDWVTATGFDDERVVAIVLDFPINRFLKPMRSVLFNATVNEDTIPEFRLRPFTLSSSTTTRFRQISSFVKANNNPLPESPLRSIFIDRLSFPLIDVPVFMNDTVQFQFLASGEVLCPAFYAPPAPTLLSVGLPAPNTTTVTLTCSVTPTCPSSIDFTIQITLNGLANKTVQVTPSTVGVANLTFVVDVADIAQQGALYEFKVRSNSAAGFSDWSNEIRVVLQPTPLPIEHTADWHHISSTMVNLTLLVGDQANQIAELRRQLSQANTRMDSMSTTTMMNELINAVKSSLDNFESQLGRYNGNLALQKIMETVKYSAPDGMFRFNNLRATYIVADTAVLSCKNTQVNC